MYPPSYRASRERFRSRLAEVRTRWPDARLCAHHLSGTDDLTIDWLEADAPQPMALVLLTAGEHGAEAYVGAAVLGHFLDVIAPQLDPTQVGLRLVHAINPWGMQHGRRVNRNNVDLNRNFWWPGFPASLPPAADYALLEPFLNPTGSIEHLPAAQLAILGRLAAKLVRLGTARIRAATLMGQYQFREGIYHGGEATQEETHTMSRLYADCLDRYARVIHVDLHTGYGPRDQMSIVNSALDPRDPSELRRRFNYPIVLRSTPEEFYAIHGDMIDYVNALARSRGRQEHVYATTFEFGTVGESFTAVVHSLLTMILENRLWRFGGSDAARRTISRDFRELFAPTAPAWQAKALIDARQAFEGILRAEGLLGNS